MRTNDFSVDPRNFHEGKYTGILFISWVSMFLFLPADVSALRCPCSFTSATLIEVLDGETAWFQVEGKRILVHLEGIDAPKLKSSSKGKWCPEEGEKATQARDFVIQVLNKAKEIRINLEGKKRDGIIRTGVYADGLSVGQELLYKYLAVKQSSRQVNWCD